MISEAKQRHILLKLRMAERCSTMQQPVVVQQMTLKEKRLLLLQLPQAQRFQVVAQLRSPRVALQTTQAVQMLLLLLLVTLKMMVVKLLQLSRQGARQQQMPLAIHLKTTMLQLMAELHDSELKLDMLMPLHLMKSLLKMHEEQLQMPHLWPTPQQTGPLLMQMTETMLMVAPLLLLEPQLVMLMLMPMVLQVLPPLALQPVLRMLEESPYLANSRSNFQRLQLQLLLLVMQVQWKVMTASLQLLLWGRLVSGQLLQILSSLQLIQQ